MNRRCTNGCSGILRPSEANPTFTRRGSRVEVTIYHVPVDTCPTCGQEFLASDVSQQIDEILEPFHGRGSHVPTLPPAKILVEFPRVISLREAA